MSVIFEYTVDVWEFDGRNDNVTSVLQSFRLFARSDVMSSLEEEQPGDAALKDARDGRSLQQRLHLIEQELAHLTTAVDLEVCIMIPRLHGAKLSWSRNFGFL